MPRPMAGWIAAALVTCTASNVYGQGSAPLEVGAVAPGFALTGATEEGLEEAPVRLEDFAGKTVVLAFFYRARTKG